MGEPPLAYLQELRLDTARQLLQSTNLTIAEIAHADPPMLYLHVTADIYGVSNKVQNFTPRTDQVLWLFDVSLAE